MIQELQHIVEKFWAGTATDVEKQRLIRQLTQEEQTWQNSLRGEFDNDLRSDQKPLTDRQSALVLARLHRQILGETAVRPIRVSHRFWASWVAAAMLVLVSGWLIYRYTLAPATVSTITQRSVRQPWQLTHKTNTSHTVMNVALADGSTLKLQPGSRVSYYEPFGQSSRDISMSGDVLYVVAKDPAHPFTVLANGITTTALGTQFRVQTTTRHRVSIRLLEGRVVVRATPTSGLTMTDTYLKPGQELNVDTQSATLSVTAFRPLSTSATAVGPTVVSPARPNPPGLVFNKESLETVLNRVSQRYNVPIDVNPADVQGLSFSGSFAANDSVTVVLNAVCLTNNLSFTQESGRIVVSRAP